MDIISIPFNKHIRIRTSEKEGCLLEIADESIYLNHIGTVHASAQFALAEATSGQYLQKILKEYEENKVIPVVRSVETKYRKPAKGVVYSSANVNEDELEKAKKNLKTKGRTMLEILVQLHDENNNMTMVSKFTWYIEVVE
ncbi:YiiD C-terminal domain-containing protein [Ruminiclostridium josui]|uniref:YiiD C-terminal domain-containing protein n=1 Tax=Ruminiclostridium josui TaxID=1499 RepID=UPI000466E93C|nr:YiiD C-terminal domain-containing protein [Ruminiclostridium josui]